jgi:Leucine Rich repeat
VFLHFNLLLLLVCVIPFACFHFVTLTSPFATLTNTHHTHNIKYTNLNYYLFLQTFGLVAMSVAGNGVDDDGLEALSMLLRQANAQLQWLGLNHNRFSLRGIRALSSTLPINRTLCYLNLSNCKLGPAEIICLVEVR